MFSAELKKSSPRVVNRGDDVRPNHSSPLEKEQTASSDPSLLRTLLGTCGGMIETAALLLGPSDCMSCMDESLRPSRSPRRSSKKMASSKARLKLAQKLKDSPSREGEVVDVPIKLVKSRSGNVKKDETGQEYDPYRSFDDSISAISAHTLDEMARKSQKPLMQSLNAGKNRPRNGDELAAPPPPELISSDDSSEASGKRDQANPHDEVDSDIPFRRNFGEPHKDKRSTYHLIENDIPFVTTRPKRRKNTGKKPSTKKSNGPTDAHLAPTPKARGRKSRRRTSSKRAPHEELVEPQVAEI